MMLVIELSNLLLNEPYPTKLRTFVLSKFGYTLKLVSNIFLASSTEEIFILSSVNGAEKTPVSKFLLTFSVAKPVNIKLPKVSPPPCVNWLPTRLFENVPAPLGFCGGHENLSIFSDYILEIFTEINIITPILFDFIE